MNTVKGKYYTLEVCKACRKSLSSDERMYSSGTCPYCGAGNDSTIVNTDKRILRAVYKNTLFMLLDNFTFGLIHIVEGYEELEEKG